MADRGIWGLLEAWWYGDGACEAEVKTKTRRRFGICRWRSRAAKASASIVVGPPRAGRCLPKRVKLVAKPCNFLWLVCVQRGRNIMEGKVHARYFPSFLAEKHAEDTLADGLIGADFWPERGCRR